MAKRGGDRKRGVGVEETTASKRNRQDNTQQQCYNNNNVTTTTRLPGDLVSLGMMHRTKCGQVLFRVVISLWRDSWIV